MYKIVFLLMIAFVFGNSANAQRPVAEVGKLVDDKPVLTIEKERIIEVFSANLLKLSNIKVRFNDVVLVKIADNEYALVFKGLTHKSSLAVLAENGKMNAVVSTACTTSGCDKEVLGCVVKYQFPEDEIGACSPCKGGGGCTKTYSSKSLLEAL